ncbi:hypothetical protein NL676_014656 [Syzygium grande]|nr:hypothetical protein NL676_014656 [Syzygium grande]
MKVPSQTRAFLIDGVANLGGVLAPPPPLYTPILALASAKVLVMVAALQGQSSELRDFFGHHSGSTSRIMPRERCM